MSYISKVRTNWLRFLKVTLKRIGRIFTKGTQMTGQYYRHELFAIRKDSGAILILIGALVIYPIIYAIAYKNEVVRELKTTLVDLDRSNTSHQLVKMLGGAEQIEINRIAMSMDEAKSDFFEGNSGGIVVIPKDFEKNILNGKQANVAVFADGSYFLIYRQLLSGTVKTLGTFSAGIEIKKLMMEGKTYSQAFQQRDPLPADIHYWFTPSSAYGPPRLPSDDARNYHHHSATNLANWNWYVGWYSQREKSGQLFSSE